jgi:hypothetical protein
MAASNAAQRNRLPGGIRSTEAAVEVRVGINGDADPPTGENYGGRAPHQGDDRTDLYGVPTPGGRDSLSGARLARHRRRT